MENAQAMRDWTNQQLIRNSMNGKQSLFGDCLIVVPVPDRAVTEFGLVSLPKPTRWGNYDVIEDALNHGLVRSFVVSSRQVILR